VENGSLDLGATDTRRDGDEWKRMVIVPTCEYKSRCFHLTLNADLNEHFFSLMSSYTSYNLVNIVGLSSNHHIRLYEYMMMLGPEQEPIPIQKFRALMGVTDKYLLFKNLRARVIDPAVTAINQFTDVDLTYELKIHEKEVTHIAFSMKKKTPALILQNGNSPADEQTKSTMKMLDHLQQFGLPIETAHKVLSLHKGSEEDFYESVAAAADYIDDLKRKNVKDPNVSGAIYKAVKEKWRRKKAAVNPNQPSLHLVPAQTQPKPDQVDIEHILVQLEQDESILAEFMKYLDRVNNRVVPLLIAKHGIRGTKMDEELTAFWQTRQPARALG
jgi:plasmid replication initiation protein